MAEKRDDKAIIKEALERFALAEEAMRDTYAKAQECLKFRLGEQWPANISRERSLDGRPCLTVDKCSQFIRQIVNDAKQNKPAIRVTPKADTADDETAEMIAGLIRHVEYTSRSYIAYDTAIDHAIEGGVGYFRVNTRYVDDESLDQEIYIERIRNRFNVLLDPFSQMPDGSDSHYGFVFVDIPREQFEEQYPNADPNDWDRSTVTGDWLNDETVRICEYYRIESAGEKIIAIGESSRTVTNQVCEWYKMTAGEILESTVLHSKNVPILRVIGEEFVDGTKTRFRGALELAMDPQRMFNYSASAFIENVALAPTAPFIAADSQVDQYADEWKSANKRNVAVLRYKPFALNGTPIPPPLRQEPPGLSAGWATSIQIFEQGVQSAFGMYKASVGRESNAIAGVAIRQQRAEGDTVNFHYIDNLAMAIEHAGRIIVDMIPHVYDTRRVLQIMGEDGRVERAIIDPNTERAMTEVRDMSGKLQKVFNPRLGRYVVSVSVGPSFSTKREEAAAWMVQLIQAQPSLLPMIGDIVFRNQDLPGSREIADRLEMALPPEMRRKDGDEMVPMAALIAEIEKRDMAFNNLMLENQQLKQGYAQKMAQEAMRQQGENARTETEQQTKRDLGMLEADTRLEVARIANADERAQQIRLILESQQSPQEKFAAIAQIIDTNEGMQ